MDGKINLPELYISVGVIYFGKNNNVIFFVNQLIHMTGMILINYSLKYC